MDEAFVIMQIGNKQTDDLYKDVIVPVLKKAGLDPKRVDKHNDGELIMQKVIGFLTDAKIIIADLTNSRPNCYLEIGFAMGLGKNKNLILIAREDHYHGSPNYNSSENKIHFDLGGYNILFWDPQKTEEFGVELLKSIKRRQYVIQPQAIVSLTSDWFSENAKRAEKGLKANEWHGSMEVRVALESSQSSFGQIELRDAARLAPISTFGWPIGVFLENRDDARPKPTSEGITAEIATPKDYLGGTYDYWSLRNNGDFYLLQSLFEDSRKEGVCFFDTRIVRMTETLLYLSRLYYNLKVDPQTKVKIQVTHRGLKGRHLIAAGNRIMFLDKTSSTDVVTTKIETTVDQLESKIVDHLEKLTSELFVMFDYFKLEKNILEEIVNNFIAGKIS